MAAGVSQSNRARDAAQAANGPAFHSSEDGTLPVCNEFIVSRHIR